MANTRQSAKRARQNDKRRARNQNARAATQTTLKKALEAIKTRDAAKAKEAYEMAIKALSKASSKGILPKGRASRRISRLTLLAKKMLPEALNFTNKR